MLTNITTTCITGGILLLYFLSMIRPLCGLDGFESVRLSYAEEKCCKDKLKNGTVCPINNTVLLDLREKVCINKCESGYALSICPHTCNDCDRKKWQEEVKDYTAERRCCWNDRQKGKRQDCEKSNKKRWCTKCQTWEDFGRCPHSCDDCDEKKYWTAVEG